MVGCSLGLAWLFCLIFDASDGGQNAAFCAPQSRPAGPNIYSSNEGDGRLTSRVCQVTGKRPAVGNNRSFIANNATRWRRFLPNLQTHRFWVEGEKRFVSLRVSTKACVSSTSAALKWFWLNCVPAALRYKEIESWLKVFAKNSLNSSAGTGHFYTTTRTSAPCPEKMEIKKFDPVIRQRVIYKAKSSNYLVSLQKPGLVPGFIAGIQYTADSEGRLAVFKLSRKGWNNVIIVVVLIVITLLHRLEQAQQENSAKRVRCCRRAPWCLTWQRAELADRAYRPGLAQRAGSGAAAPSWRPASRCGKAGCPRRARARRPGDLKIWIAGQSDPVEVGLYQDDGKVCRLLPSSTWLSLSQAQYRDLMRPIP